VVLFDITLAQVVSSVKKSKDQAIETEDGRRKHQAKKVKPESFGQS
jgi:hypothetical protein